MRFTFILMAVCVQALFFIRYAYSEGNDGHEVNYAQKVKEMGVCTLHEYSDEDDWLEFLKAYVAIGGDVNATDKKCWDGYTFLHDAAMMQDIVAIRWLVKNGANINARDVWENTPLHLAIEDGCEGTMKGFGVSDFKGARELVKLGADQTLKNKNGETPADIAKNYDVDIIYRAVDSALNQ